MDEEGLVRMLWSCVMLILALAPAALGAENTEGQPMASRVVLEGVDRYRVVEPLFEGVRVILNARGDVLAGICGGDLGSRVPHRRPLSVRANLRCGNVAAGPGEAVRV
jgi:hypothetical protein